MRRLLWMVALATVLATGVSFVATRWITTRQMHSSALGTHDLVGLRKSLGLTDQQSRELAAAEQEYRAKLDEACKKHCAARYELGTELGKATVDQTSARKYVDQMCAAQADVEHATLSHILKVRDVLTPEQREQYAKLVSTQVCTTCPMGMHQP